MHLQEVIIRYAAGYFPLYDPWDRFYWERLPLRAVIAVNDASLTAARRLRRSVLRKSSFEIRYTTAVDQVVSQLRDVTQGGIKEHSWVRDEVTAIYRELHAAGLIRTVEAWREGKLAGALLGIVLPGMFIAETMFGVVSGASKLCLCELLEECARSGCPLIDVQTPHDLDEYGDLLHLNIPEPASRTPSARTPHPCLRLGEQVLPVGEFMQHFAAAWKAAFPGAVIQWLAVTQVLAGMQADPRIELPPGLLEQGRRILQLARRP
jgi:leucyl/phenylalanyl-tRNA--protein transferase